jgi:glycerol-3-phosphate dehydrogenase (NAD(P)+)
MPRGDAMKVAVVGAGSWGTALAVLCQERAPVTLWARNPDLAARMSATRENVGYLPGIEVPARVTVTAELDTAVGDADVIVMAVPSHGFRTVLELAAPFVRGDACMVSVAKGVERTTLLRMSEIVRQVLPTTGDADVAALSGPNFAMEIARGQPAASVVACADDARAQALQQVFMTGRFRVYTNPDVVGCELAGALKNVIAIAAGIADGLGYGDNTRAALITRGLAELARLGVVLGGQPLTFSGLAGMGDLVATCTSDQSRNRRVGVELGRGRSLEEILGGSQQVAEAVNTTAAVLELATRAGVEMPIAARVGQVLYEGRRPAEIVGELMGREAKPELDGPA